MHPGYIDILKRNDYAGWGKAYAYRCRRLK